MGSGSIPHKQLLQKRGDEMDWNQIQGVVRAVLTALGGWMVGKGYFDQTAVNDLVGAVLVIGGAVWSVMHKRQQAATPT